MAKVIIIGGGLGGLTAGNWLVQRGHAAVIFESQGSPGGYVAGFRRKGFYFESGTLAFENARQVFELMERFGVRGKVSFVRKRTRFVSREMDTGDSGTFESFRDAFLRAFPDDRVVLQDYFREVGRMYRAMRPFMAERSPTLLQVLSGGLTMLGAYAKYRKVTLSEFTGRFFRRGTRLFQVFKSFGYPDMASYILGGAMATIFDGYWAVAGGMQSWADALAERFTALGGELRLHSKVDRIITENGAAVGVVCGGAEHRGDAVISAADYKKTFLNLLDDPSLLPPEFADRVRGARVSEGMCTAYLGLNLSNEQLRRYMRLPSVMFLDDAVGLEPDAGDPRYFEKAGIGLYAPSLYNETLAPEGKSSLMLQAVCPTHWMDNWGGGDRAKYTALKESVIRTFVAKASFVVPGLARHIEFADLATLLTYERYTGNSDGATSAWSWNPKNKYYDSFMDTYVTTPVRNLYIGSCWSTQIGGIPGALSGGLNAAKRAVRRWARTEGA